MPHGTSPGPVVKNLSVEKVLRGSESDCDTREMVQRVGT